MILENTIKKASQLLKNKNIYSHTLDAEIILSDIMGVTREFLLTNQNIQISEKTLGQYNKAIERRIKKEPVAYIIGKKEFWSQDFLVNSATLIPRPETELLIYKVVDFFKNKKINILDIGTGSGCILLSILKELKNSRGIGIDISAKAVQTAILNSKKLNLFYRSKFKVFDINKFYVGRYDLIVSNPPYISLSEMKNLSKSITNYEPLVALNGGSNGLDFIKKVIYKSNGLIKKNGLFALEIGNCQYLKVSSLLRQHGYREMFKEFDYNRNVRCIISTKV
tara:strand:+ start:233 stop:1072 length:840 start_codon:yes stop_codon:yes gene_type:complete